MGFIHAPTVGEVRLDVRGATDGGSHGLEEPGDTIVFSIGTYGEAIAANELREAFLHHRKPPETAGYTEIRQKGFYGVLIKLRLTAVRKLGKNARNVVPLRKNPSAPVAGVGTQGDQFEFAVGLPLYDAAGFVIDLRRYSVLGGIGRDVLKPATELLKNARA